MHHMLSHISYRFSLPIYMCVCVTKVSCSHVYFDIIPSHPQWWWGYSDHVCGKLTKHRILNLAIGFWTPKNFILF